MNIRLPAKKKMAFSLCMAIVFFSFLASPAYAQQNFNVLHFTNDNVLPQSSANRIAFDKYGYTWISSQFGLVRYDGSHFRTYNTFNTPAIKSNRFTYVANDVEGNIYAVDARSVVMQLTDTGFIDRPELHHDQNCFFSVQFVNFKDIKVKHSNPLNSYRPFNENDTMRTFFYLDSLRFYFVSQKFAGYFDGKKLYTHPLDEAINSFMNGGLLFALLKNGTFNVYKGSTRLRSGLRIEGEIMDNEAFKNGGITSSVFTPDPDSNAYIYLNHALYLLTGNSSHVTTRLLGDSLESKNCFYIGHNAKTGAYYLCSAVEGVYVLEPKNFKSLVIPSTPGNTNLNAHYAVVEAGKNKILSTNNYVFENKKVISFPYNILSRYCLYRDLNYHIFFQVDTEMYETDTSFNVVAKYPLGSGDGVKCINKDGNGNLWIVAINKLGVLKKGTSHFSFKEFPFKHIESFIIQNDSLIWFATPGGLFLFNTQNQLLKEIKELNGSYVRILKLDSNGALWIGTYGQGFYRYKDQLLVRFPPDKNGYLSMAHCFMEDKNGFFWIPTNRGLFQVKKSDLNSYADGKSKTVYYQYYDKSSGFTTNEFNGGCNPCGTRISDGSFILPSINGLVKFNPDSVRALMPDGPIFIDKISTDSILYPHSGPFALSSQFHQLVIEVSGVYYGNPYNNNIEYHLEGLNDDWYPLNEERKITFTSLPYGDYTLQLRRLAGFGPDNYVHKNVSFTVAPGFLKLYGFAFSSFYWLSYLSGLVFVSGIMH